ncbi:MAG: response regulator, partial [Candidatus Thiodiazotropha sp.]
LSKVGIQFTEACSGYEALQQTRSGLFDLVLMDIQMPDISGTEVAKRLREELASVPVLIAATAHAFPEQREAIFEAGFSDLLVKPIGMDDLRRVLTQAYLGSYNERKISVNHG